MYSPRRYTPKDPNSALAFIKAHSFAQVSAIHQDQIIGVHIPLMISDSDPVQLVGHIAKGNEISKCLEREDQLMASFIEHHTYISSSWYEQVNVPTWNYIAVHVYGRPRVLSREETIEHLSSMTQKYEQASVQPFKMEHMSDAFLDAHLKGLVAFAIQIEKVEANYKLSQNRNDRDFAEIVKQLRLRGDEMSIGIADHMEAERNTK